ncbi:Phox homologous domain [Phytophthora cinnamomi]|uniref:Phox homologous domain n=1 Tax=Phytophthora cinnamomi TaxID=4785 RepID=UPI00355A5AD1|nr:Phox homologous domain [Phytophthora cinnamomi]
MGCSHSTTNNPTQQFSGIEFSITELSVAKRPGGPDVGPVRTERVKLRRHNLSPGEPELEDELIPTAAAKPKQLPAGVLMFSVTKVVANEDGAILYVFSGTTAEDPTDEVVISKRYSQFKAMHAQISELMARERNVPLTQQHLFATHPALPEMPKANAWTYVRGSYSDRVLEEREEQFTRILNAIARHPVAFKSKTFTDFLLG